jgi:hypothetical protein
VSDQAGAFLLAVISAQDRAHKEAELRRRAAMASRQGWSCTWCMEPLTAEQIAIGGTAIDHIIPLSRGGPTLPEWNHELLHRRCNAEKRNRLTSRAVALAAEHGVTLRLMDPAKLTAALREALELVERAGRVMDELECTAVSPRGETQAAGLLEQITVTAAELTTRLTANNADSPVHLQ